jgi:hypothetical protein
MTATGDLAEQFRLAGQRRRSGNRLHGAHVHDEHHRRGAATLGERFGDCGEGAQPLAAAVLGGDAHAEQLGTERRMLSLGNRPVCRPRAALQDAGQRAGAF